MQCGCSRHPKRFHEPVDVFVQRTWLHGVALRVVVPPPVREVSARLGGTTLAAARAPLSARLAREIARPVFRARMALRSHWETR